MEILNYINGEWIKPNVSEYLEVILPSTGRAEVLGSLQIPRTEFAIMMFRLARARMHTSLASEK